MAHIPSGPTAALDILPFSQALAQAFVPNDDYDVEKWLYVPNAYSDYRYILGSRGQRPLICVGINPSTAAPDHLDNTLKSVDRIAHANGYDSFLMFNVYAQRSTDPDAMEPRLNPLLHGENLKAFQYLLSISDTPAIWAAWGAIIEKRDYLSQCVRELVRIGQAAGAQWYRAGQVSKKGHPHHPLYLKKEEPLVPFDVSAYLDRLKGGKSI